MVPDNRKNTNDLAYLLGPALRADFVPQDQGPFEGARMPGTIVVQDVAQRPASLPGDVFIQPANQSAKATAIAPGAPTVTQDPRTAAMFGQAIPQIQPAGPGTSPGPTLSVRPAQVMPTLADRTAFTPAATVAAAGASQQTSLAPAAGPIFTGGKETRAPSDVPVGWGDQTAAHSVPVVTQRATTSPLPGPATVGSVMTTIQDVNGSVRPIDTQVGHVGPGAFFSPRVAPSKPARQANGTRRTIAVANIMDGLGAAGCSACLPCAGGPVIPPAGVQTAASRRLQELNDRLQYWIEYYRRKWPNYGPHFWKEKAQEAVDEENKAKDEAKTPPDPPPPTKPQREYYGQNLEEGKPPVDPGPTGPTDIWWYLTHPLAVAGAAIKAIAKDFSEIGSTGPTDEMNAMKEFEKQRGR